MTSVAENILSTIRLAKKKQVRGLNLSGWTFDDEDKLTSIPAEVFELVQLEALNLGGNLLTSLPESISRLENLHSLHLSDNQLTALPNSLSRLHKLDSLALSRNQLTSLPESISQLQKLSWLNLADNRLEALPQSMAYMPHLRWLNVRGNPLQIPPLEVVAQGVEAIKNYLKQIDKEGIDYLYEAKLLIVGEGGAGKTTLARKLKDPNCELREEDSTKGIEIIRWSFNMENRQPFRVNIWDFGGQEIYHATHQFFLTRRSLYALVADARKEDTDFYYWLNLVELLSDNSPVLIINNEKQDRRREINENQLRGEFSNLKEVLATNLATNRELHKIRSEIRHHISHLPQVGTQLPKTWVKVREALENDTRSYVSLDEYLDICEQNGFRSLKDKLQLSGYLHDLGVCLHFQHDPLLRKTVILKPKWGTDAVYRVLDNRSVAENLGRFTRADLGGIWEEAEYANMHDELLQLMINFKLCYQIPNSEFYIAPQLLSGNQAPYEWQEKDNLVMRYAYQFLPKGIITQFIVAMHQHILEEKYVWKTGVILRREKAKAEVIEHYSKREIRIRVAGKNPKELMTIVSHELEKIHSSYKRLRYSQLIPCNCAQCSISQEPHFYRLEILRQFVDDGQEFIQCQRKPYQMVPVRRLIEQQHSQSVRDQVFISYSHQDKQWLDKLQTTLKPLTRKGQLSVWADTEIRAGSKWEVEIREALASAKVAVLLVSQDFLASDFIADDELPPLLGAAEEKGLTILWVPVTDSLYKDTEIGKYQAASDPSKPLDSLSQAEVHRVLVNICEQIKEAANRYH